MPQFKGSLYMNNNLATPFGNGYGWSENFALKAADYAGAWANLYAIAQARLGMLPPSYGIAFGKVSAMNMPPDAYWSAVDGTQIKGPGTLARVDATDTDLPPTVALLVRVEGQGYQWGMRFLRGMTHSNMDSATYAYTPKVGFQDALTAFENALIANAVLLVKAPLGAPQAETIVSCVPIRGGWCRVGRPFGVPLGRARTR